MPHEPGHIEVSLEGATIGGTTAALPQPSPAPVQVFPAFLLAPDGNWKFWSDEPDSKNPAEDYFWVGEVWQSILDKQGFTEFVSTPEGSFFSGPNVPAWTLSKVENEVAEVEATPLGEDGVLDVPPPTGEGISIIDPETGKPVPGLIGIDNGDGTLTAITKPNITTKPDLPAIGHEFTDSQNNTWVHTGGGNYVKSIPFQEPGGPSISQQLADAFHEGDFDKAREIRDFLNVPSNMQEIVASLFRQATELGLDSPEGTAKLEEAQSAFNFATQPTQVEALNLFLDIAKSPKDIFLFSALAGGANLPEGLTGLPLMLTRLVDKAQSLGLFPNALAAEQAVSSGFQQGQQGGVGAVTEEQTAAVAVGQAAPVVAPSGVPAVSPFSEAQPPAAGPAALSLQDPGPVQAAAVATPIGGTIPTVLPSAASPAAAVGATPSQDGISPSLQSGFIQPEAAGLPTGVANANMGQTAESAAEQAGDLFGLGTELQTGEGIPFVIPDRIAATLTGKPVTQFDPTGFAAAQGVTIPSAQTFAKLSPQEQGSLIAAAELLGIPQAEFLQGIGASVPGGRSISPFLPGGRSATRRGNA